MSGAETNLSGVREDEEDFSFDVVALEQTQMPAFIWNLGLGFRWELEADGSES